MKRALKILGITLGSIIGVVVLTIGLALWVVFTPERLTPIVRNVANDLVTTEHTIGQVDLTFFSTFPRFGLAIDSVVVINPMEGATSDTVVAIPHMVVSVDVMAFLTEQTLSIPTLSVPEIEANIFVAADGQANYDVLALGGDTTNVEESSNSALPFKQIEVGQLALSARALRYVSLPDTMDIVVQGARIDAHVADWNEILLTLAMSSIDAQIGSTSTKYTLKICTI